MQKETRFIHFLRSKPIFILLFPVFFVFHGFTVNYDSVPADHALFLTLKYIVLSFLIAGVFWLLFRNITKACLMTFGIMVFHFFFGNILDIIKEILPGEILRYRYFLPFCLFLFIILFIFLKKRKKNLTILSAYLNLLLIILILFDVGLLFTKIPVAREKKVFHPAKKGLKICDTCSRPDIFLIIPDQYAGYSALKDVFNFDNSAFENELKKRGFHIPNKSRSNYNFTPFSVASMLNMEFLSLNKGKQNYSTVRYSYEIIRNSRVLKFLTASGYKFYNCSIFDFDDQPAYKYSAFLPYGINLVTAQTFITRLTDDFRQDILDGKLGLKKLRKKLAYENLEFNDKIISLTSEIASEQNNQPKFVYTHLMMPHYPYYYDSKGNPLPIEKLGGLNRVNAKDYIEYLQYSNKRLLELTDHILASSPSPPIIIILSDHGFRHPEKNVDPSYDFINLNSVYFPDKDYSGFYDSITNVNMFRIVFNKYFKQNLQLLKDSTISLRD